MKKIICFGIVFLSFFGCVSEDKGPKRLYEEGVEIITNRREPSILQKEKDGFLETEKELIIDLEEKADGVFKHRLSADILLNSRTPINAVVKNNRLYYIREKYGGFCQFVVKKILQ